MADSPRTPWYERVFWSVHARSYDDFAGSDSPQVGEVVTAVQRVSAESALSVLDVGAGTGNYAIPMASAGHRVMAIDVAPGMLDRLRAKAETRGIAIETRQADVHRGIPCEDSSFDVVLCIYVLQVIRDPASFFAEMRRVLRGSGHLVLATENPMSPRANAIPANARPLNQLVWRAKRVATRVARNAKVRPRDELLGLAERAGYDLVEELADEHRIVFLLRSSGRPAR